MAWLDEVKVGYPEMRFTHGQKIVRERAVQVPDPYNPDSTEMDWGDPDVLEIPGAYIYVGGSSTEAGAARESTASDAQLVIDDPGADVQRGDRIRQGNRLWVVDGFQDAPINPFDGWQPILVCNLEEDVG